MRTTPVNDGTIYNIWYNRYTGGDKPRFAQIERSNTRCVLSRDAGKTKCRPKAFHCIHFARGCCSRGADCQVIHYTIHSFIFYHYSSLFTIFQ